MSTRAGLIGTLRPRKGAVVHGHMDVLDHPSGFPERLPLAVAQGKRPGPTVFLTGNIHGDELTGMHVIHDLLASNIAKEVRGTIIAIPSLNPTGLGALQRIQTFDVRDPNRLFPDPAPKRKRKNPRRRAIDRIAVPEEPICGEAVMRQVYELITAHADAYLDLHCATTWSLPIVFLDPVFYRTKRERGAAQKLFQRTLEMARATGLTLIREEPPPRYLKRNMHRTSTGSVLNGGRIPALTLELGMSRAVDPVALEAGTIAVRNVLRHLGMLPGDAEPQPRVPMVSNTGGLRGVDHPRSKAAGVVRFHVAPGDRVEAGQRIATIRRLDGRTARGGVIRAELDGTVLWLRGDGTTYVGVSLAVYGVEDRLPMVLHWSDPA